MKKERGVALLLAACFLSPLALACNQPALESDDSQEAESSISESVPIPEPEPTPEPTLKTSEYIRSVANVNIRSGAGTSFAVVGNAEKGTMYAMTEKVGGWYKTYYRGKVAYISASYAVAFSLERADDAVEAVVEEGYKLLGVPYVYGAVRYHDGNGKRLTGFTAQKFDCSSLMQYIFYKGAERLMGLHTRAQVRQGVFVPRNQLRRGDCIFFTNESREHNVGVERVGHVALYLGDGYILHTSSDYARIEKMTAKRWGYYIEARRFL